MKRSHLTLAILGLLVVSAVTAGAVIAGRSGSPAGTGAQTAPAVGAGELALAPRIDSVIATRIPKRMIPGAGEAELEIVISGNGYFGTSFGPYVRLNGKDALAVVMDEREPDKRLVAYAPGALRGNIEVVVENPDRQSARAFVDVK